MNERDGMGRLIDVEPSFSLKKSHSYSILKTLWKKKFDRSGQKALDVNDKILVQDSEWSIHPMSFEKSKILHNSDTHLNIFDSSVWSERNLLYKGLNFDTFILNETNRIDLNKKIPPWIPTPKLEEVKKEYEKYFP